MSKFKVGDKVKAVATTLWWRKGDAGVIAPRPDGGFRVALEGGETWWFCNEEESSFKLVEPKTDMLIAANKAAEMFSDMLTAKQRVVVKSDGLEWIPLAEDGGGTVGGPVVNCRCTLKPKIKEYPNPPHKHKDVIFAWVNGADIEVSVGGDEWYETLAPQWIDTLEYRVKPTKTPLEIKIEKLEAKLVKLKGQL